MKRPGCVRFLIGVGAVILLLAAGFAVMLAVIPTWGADAAEIASRQPGDEIVKSPTILWDHAITIDATPEQVWPWIIQMGDSRAAYYSYTFIENIFAGYPMYNNASTIHAEWQNPPKGQGMIMNFLVIADYQPGQYLLAATTPEAMGFTWTWLWAIQPLDATHTRLYVRHRIGLPAGYDSPLIAGVTNLTGYVMEKNMLEGIRQRAEGIGEPGFIEPLEIALWLFALLCGLAGAVLFLRRADWWPLLFGAAAIVVIFGQTYLQPGLITRVLLDALLAGGWALLALRPAARKAAFIKEPAV